MVATDKPYQVIGTRPVRPDGADKVTGRAEYGADVSFPRMAFGRMLRSPIAHGVIKSIDTSKAEALPGVLAVVTGKDLPDPGERIIPTMRGLTPLKWIRGAIIAQDKVLYRGHPVAAVAATDQHIAEDALDLIEVEYDELPPVLDVQEAMTEAAPVLHEDMRTEDLVTAVMGAAGETNMDRPTNVAKHVELAIGDVEAGFAEADVIVEGEFSTAMAHQGYIEPHVSTALWNRDGELIVWTTTQGAFGIRDLLAEMLELPVSRIKVIPTEIGGGFGGKTKLYLEPVAALLSRKLRRP
ncbi:MAG: molybdopterin-dependent oxidoreductase, partial [Chloroflexi bacterium]|nr:molybdopterin-dependent oxidoreductase [Chloroflexota bacterium]